MPSKPKPARPRPYPDPLAPQNPLVSRRWVVVAVLGMLLTSLLLGYGTLVLLVWQGQWQILFHPSHTVARTPAAEGLFFAEVRFDAAETGQPLLTGWWVPAAAPARITVLFLHGASGSLADTVPNLVALHQQGVNVFAFDPRGFGRSAWAKPSERRMQEDARSALDYLVDTRHLSLRSVMLCGQGLGASVAAHLADSRPGVAGLILIDPQPPVLPFLLADRRANLVPLRLIAHDRFDPSGVLAASSIPKLFIATPETRSPVPFFAAARSPKMLVSSASAGLPLAGAPAQAALQRFFSPLR